MEQNLMAPLWLKYPSIPEGSIGWRMGYGESYAEQFYQWFYKLTPEEQNDYKYKFPEPVCWSLSEHNIKRRGDFWLYNWEAAKSNMESVESLKKTKESESNERQSFSGDIIRKKMAMLERNVSVSGIGQISMWDI